jgi:hypothetical protein
MLVMKMRKMTMRSIDTRRRGTNLRPRIHLCIVEMIFCLLKYKIRPPNRPPENNDPPRPNNASSTEIHSSKSSIANIRIRNKKCTSCKVGILPILLVATFGLAANNNNRNHNNRQKHQQVQNLKESKVLFAKILCTPARRIDGR